MDQHGPLSSTSSWSSPQPMIMVQREQTAARPRRTLGTPIQIANKYLPLDFVRARPASAGPGRRPLGMRRSSSIWLGERRITTLDSQTDQSKRTEFVCPSTRPLSAGSERRSTARQIGEKEQNSSIRQLVHTHIIFSVTHTCLSHTHTYS
jgi:hypothetical protein